MRYRIGSIITYTTFTGDPRTVRVEEKMAEVKNGRSGFAGHIVSEDGERAGYDIWGYDSQIVQVDSF